MIRPSWDEYFLLQAKLAASRSTCNSRPQGAILVKNKHIIATGYNGSLPGQMHCLGQTILIDCEVCKGIGIHPLMGGRCNFCEQGKIKSPYCHRRAQGVNDNQKDRACLSSHAETNAIAQAAKLGVSTDGSVLYCTTRPCVVCAKLLIQSGINKVFYELDYDSQEENWIDTWLDMERLIIQQDVIVLAQSMLEPTTSHRRLSKTS